MEYSDLIKSLLKNNLTLSICETITGGLLTSTIANQENSEKSFLGSNIYYNKESLNKLHLNNEVITSCGLYSKEICKDLLLKTIKSFESNCGIIILGDKENTNEIFVGTFIKGQTHIYELNLDSDLDEIKNQCINFAFETLNKEIEEFFVN